MVSMLPLCTVKTMYVVKLTRGSIHFISHHYYIHMFTYIVFRVYRIQQPLCKIILVQGWRQEDCGSGWPLQLSLKLLHIHVQNQVYNCYCKPSLLGNHYLICVFVVKHVIPNIVITAKSSQASICMVCVYHLYVFVIYCG